nr:hypothetical protein CFP56_73826 [Quercus suber]
MARSEMVDMAEASRYTLTNQGMGVPWVDESRQASILVMKSAVVSCIVNGSMWLILTSWRSVCGFHTFLRKRRHVHAPFWVFRLRSKRFKPLPDFVKKNHHASDYHEPKYRSFDILKLKIPQPSCQLLVSMRAMIIIQISHPSLHCLHYVAGETKSFKSLRAIQAGGWSTSSTLRRVILIPWLHQSDR